jgi:hypothetical protein
MGWLGWRTRAAGAGVPQTTKDDISSMPDTIRSCAGSEMECRHQALPLLVLPQSTRTTYQRARCHPGDASSRVGAGAELQAGVPQNHQGRHVQHASDTIWSGSV